jgi:hypothetical protein
LHHASLAQHSLDEQRRRSTDTVPSDNKASASCDNNNKDKNYHLHFDKKLKAGCVVVVPVANLTSKAKLNQKSKKKEMFPSFLDDDLYFYRHHLNGTQFH